MIPWISNELTLELSFRSLREREWVCLQSIPFLSPPSSFTIVSKGGVQDEKIDSSHLTRFGTRIAEH